MLPITVFPQLMKAKQERNADELIRILGQCPHWPNTVNRALIEIGAIDRLPDAAQVSGKDMPDLIEIIESFDFFRSGQQLCDAEIKFISELALEFASPEYKTIANTAQ